MSTAVSVLNAITLPDSNTQRRYEALVGIDDVKRTLLSALRVAVHPAPLNEWARKQVGLDGAVRAVTERPALFVLGGDVGTGKTELAETIGDALARAERADVTLFSLSLAARGTGFVGEMTQRIVSAFDEVRSWGEKRKGHRGKLAAGILFIDEADALAQSREALQMHHEDRAGVNALIRGIDDLARARTAVAVIMATNRLDAIDPAIRRRAALVFAFNRPNRAQRQALFAGLLPHFAGHAKLQHLVEGTGETAARPYGFTYSDIVQQLIPVAILEAYEASCDLSIEGLLAAAEQIQPTPPFGANPP